MANGKGNFDEILCDAVVDGFSSLGDSVKQTICYFLATDHDIKIEEIPRRPKDFDAAIGLLLGRGANYLEDMILNQLHAAIGYDASSPGQQMSFEKRVERAARFYQSRADQ